MEKGTAVPQMGMGQNLVPCSSHQNSWDLWMFIPLKMVLIGIDPYPYIMMFFFTKHVPYLSFTRKPLCPVPRSRPTSQDLARGRASDGANWPRLPTWTGRVPGLGTIFGTGSNGEL